MSRLPGCVLWADPGKDTGLAWYAEVGFCVQELPFSAAADNIETLTRWYGRRMWFGWEHFYIGAFTPSADAHYAIEMIGICRRYALKHGCLILPHAAPSDRKVATQAMLEALGWWVPGKDDAQSAAQHLLAWMLRTGNEPPKEAAILAALRSRDRG